MNEKRNRLIHSCFDRLRGVLSQQQAFTITLGVATIKWMEHTEKYAQSSRLINNSLLDNSYLEHEVKRHEDEFPEFKGILSSFLSRSFEHTGEHIKEIYWLLGSGKLITKNDYQELINQTVQLGLQESDFNQTPSSIAGLVVKLQDLNSINSFADYGAGVSNIALEIFRQTDHRPYYYAEEINTTVSSISKLLMIVNEVKDYEIANKDIFSEGEMVGRELFDLVVSDIPRISKYHKPFSLNDPRFRYGTPGKGNQEWAYIQNVIHHLNNHGKGVVIGSKGMLVRGFEKQIRANVVEADIIECVITLPDNLYEGTNIGTEVIIFNRLKPLERKGCILFINAHPFRERLNRYQHTLTEEGVKKIMGAYYSDIEEEGFNKFVPIEKIEAYEYRLNPVEYIDFDSLKNQFDKTVPLDEIAEISRGASVSKKDLEELEIAGEYYYISIRNIDEGSINYEDATKIRPKSRDWLEKYSIEPEDILITTKGWETKVALVGSDVRNAFFSSNLTRIRVDRRIYNPYILVEFLQSDIGKKMLESIQTGTTVTLINNKQLSRMEVPVYPHELMAEIGQAMEQNKKIYEERVRLAEQEYQEKRTELMKRLGLTDGS